MDGQTGGSSLPVCLWSAWEHPPVSLPRSAPGEDAPPLGVLPHLGFSRQPRAALCAWWGPALPVDELEGLGWGLLPSCYLHNKAIFL